MSTDADIGCVAPWFGSNRMLAAHVARELDGCHWVAVPYAGGMSEVLQLSARTIVVNDMHRHVVNLAAALADDEMGTFIYRFLRRLPFHPDTLLAAQAFADAWLKHAEPRPIPDVHAAIAYFVSVWMIRSSIAGTKGESKAGLSFRWEAGGGDSNVRYRNAVRSIINWRKVLRRCTFSVMDGGEFLAKCHDAPNHGIYADPTFFDVQTKYQHVMTLAEHERLAKRLAEFQQTKVVVRFYDHAEVRRLYPESRWTFKPLDGRKQTNDNAAELLLINRREA